MMNLKLILTSFCSALTMVVSAQTLKMPKIFADHMVLQREMPVRFWGEAGDGDKVSITINGMSVTSFADADGSWEILFPAQQAGGPFEVQIESDGNINFSDVYFGDVWVAGGQSNMEWKLSWGVDNWEEEVKNSEYPQIRFFEIPNTLAMKPQDDVPQGEWKIAGPESASEFSAVAWFFAKHNHLDKNVPVGIIDSNWGGTPAEAWTSAERLSGVEGYQNAAKEMLDPSIDWEMRKKENEQREAHKWELINSEDFLQTGVHSVEFEDSSWKLINLPNQQPLQGIVWLRKHFDVDKEIKNPKLYFGDINQLAKVYLNGQLIEEETWQDTTSIIAVPEKLLKRKNNILAIRVINSWDDQVSIGRTGDMWLETNSTKISLEGPWKFSNKIEPELPEVEFFFWKPGVLYNAMIHPIAGYSIAGAIWYQGESNADMPQYYEELFETMIEDWRINWLQGRFPFLFVQLSNFMQRQNQPSESNWAELREAQADALSLPETGMAVTIDIGEGEDIHPRNKQDVGKRLWLAARKVAFNEDVVFSGPVYSSHKTEDNKIIISFSNTGSGLQAKGGELKAFELAGKDLQFYAASARIEGNNVIVFSEKVPSPEYIRYAWADNPDARLYNKDGLPAVPFRTDK